MVWLCPSFWRWEASDVFNMATCPHPLAAHKYLDLEFAQMCFGCKACLYATQMENAQLRWRAWFSLLTFAVVAFPSKSIATSSSSWIVILMIVIIIMIIIIIVIISILAFSIESIAAAAFERGICTKFYRIQSLTQSLFWEDRKTNNFFVCFLTIS